MIDKLVTEGEESLKDTYKLIDEVCLFNSEKILNAFHKYKVSSSDFYETTGYGYGDIGRDKIEKVYADVFKCEKALVRSEFISGTHALTVALFGILRPKDTLLTITGLPYDTLRPVIGIIPNESSLASFEVKYDYIDLNNNEFAYEKIKEKMISDKPKMIHIQRSIGYSARETIGIESLKKVIDYIKKIDKNIIIMVDNCYCELCGKYEPTEVGADLVVGSLIKNLGGGVASNGAYIVGKEKYVSLCAERLTAPGLGAEVGPMNQNKNILLGLYLAPRVISNALKVKLLTSFLFNKLNYQTINNNLNDIVLGIIFNDQNKQIIYTKNIQKNSAIDSNSTPVPSKMPGYSDEIIMASGSFTDGSSIELSCDAPIRKPYIIYQQGSLTYEYGKLGVVEAIKNMVK